MKKFKIMAVEKNFVVVVKSAGLGFHDERHHDQLTPGLCRLLKIELESIGEAGDVYPVHRLDKTTSGLLVFGRTSAAAAQLSQQFADHTVTKYYLALSNKKPKKKQGQIVGDMAKSRRSCWKLLTSKDSPAKTQFFSHSIADKLRLFLLRPYSGKTHQLRVAMKSLGSPICGDLAYGGSAGDDVCPFGRVFLHSFQLEFSYDGVAFCYQSLPELESVAQQLFRFDWFVSPQVQLALGQGFQQYKNPGQFNWTMDKKAKI